MYVKIQNYTSFSDFMFVSMSVVNEDMKYCTGWVDEKGNFQDC